MWRLSGRNGVVLGAVLAAALLTMQLRSEGIRGYQFSDVLSILLFAVPTVLQRTRATVGRMPPRRDGDGLSAPDQGLAPAAPSRRAHVLETLLVRTVAVVIATGAYVVALVLVLAQAWVPALSALIVCAVALAAIPSGRDEMPVRPTSAPDGG